MRKIITLVAAVAVLAGTLTGCGAKNSAQSADSNVIKVAASATPHAEVLEAAKDLLKEKGYELEIKIFDDYVLPNEVVSSGEFDANYFQHEPFMNSYNEEHNANLVAVGKIHYEPFGIYPGKKDDLASLSSGDVIAVPNDRTNEGRALKLLADKGIITLKDGVSLDATVNDIVENPYGIEIKELEAAQIPRVLSEVTFGVVNGNYALSAGLSVTKDSVFYESSESDAAKTYVNIIAVKEENKDSEKIKALVDVLKSEEIQKYIEDTYNGSVLIYEE